MDRYESCLFNSLGNKKKGYFMNDVVLNPDGTLSNEMVESFFDEALSDILKSDELKNYLTTDQKRKIMDAFDTKIETPEEGVVIVSILFVKIKVDARDVENVQLEMSVDISKLVKE